MAYDRQEGPFLAAVTTLLQRTEGGKKLWPAYIKPLIKKDYESVSIFNDPDEGRDLACRTNSFIVTFSDLYIAGQSGFKNT